MTATGIVEQPPPDVPEPPSDGGPPIDDDGSGASDGRNRLVLVVIGIVLLVVIGIIALVAVDGGGGSSTPTANVTESQAPANDSSSTAPTVPTPEPNTVLDGCQDVENDGSSSQILWFFLTDPMTPGDYSVSMTTGIGELSGAATAPAGATFVMVPVRITQFTSITHVDITGPGGQIDASFFNLKLPFTLDASTDHSFGCDGTKLHVPATAPAPATGTPDVKQQITDFLNSVAQNTHTAAGTDSLVRQLNKR